MPRCSDEIYEAKIATTNLPPRHITTIYIGFGVVLGRISTKLTAKTKRHSH